MTSESMWYGRYMDDLTSCTVDLNPDQVPLSKDTVSFEIQQTRPVFYQSSSIYLMPSIGTALDSACTYGLNPTVE